MREERNRIKNLREEISVRNLKKSKKFENQVKKLTDEYVISLNMEKDLLIMFRWMEKTPIVEFNYKTISRFSDFQPI